MTSTFRKPPATDTETVPTTVALSTSTNIVRIRLGAVSIAVAGILFVLYPATRPFSDETTLQGAAAFAFPAWMLAHMLAMVGFTLLALGLLGLYGTRRETAVEA